MGSFFEIRAFGDLASTRHFWAFSVEIWAARALFGGFRQGDAARTRTWVMCQSGLEPSPAAVVADASNSASTQPERQKTAQNSVKTPLHATSPWSTTPPPNLTTVQQRHFIQRRPKLPPTYQNAPKSTKIATAPLVHRVTTVQHLRIQTSL